jgi:serine O-acetyltransferase
MSPEPKRYEELERAIDDSAALPNKRAVVEALNHLKPVLYMGFYSTRALNRDNVRHGVAEHLYRAHELLVAQIERALTYEHWTGRTPVASPPGSGETVVLELFRTLPRIRHLLNLDVMAAYEGDPAAKSVEEVVFSYPSIEAITTYRLAHELHLRGVPLIPRIFSEHAHAITGIDIHPGATIGESFFIDHGTGVVVGESAVIGDRVKLYQGVTLGALSVPKKGEEGAKRHPTLEDDVTIYSGATILGGDTVIGRGSVVGGNVWLVSSVPAGSKVFGRGREDATPGEHDNGV